MKHDEEPTELDRLAVSAELAELAERFELEALNWGRDPIKVEALMDTKHTLANLSRVCLMPEHELAVGLAYAEGAAALIAAITVSSRYFKTAGRAIRPTAPRRTT